MIAASYPRLSYWITAMVFTLLAILTRLWFFVDVPVPSMIGDSEGYFALVTQMNNGHWPEFSIRPPGYPVFLAVVFALHDSLMAMMIAQNLLTLIASLAMIYAFHLYRPWFGVWAAVAMAVFAAGVWSFDADTSMLSDGVYSNALILAFAFLIIGILRVSGKALLVSSAMMGAAVLIRPAGMFLLVVYVMCLGFLARNHFGRKRLVMFAVPFSALLLALCTYNVVTIRTFALSEFGEINLSMATMTFWEEDASYPEEANAAIRDAVAVLNQQVTQNERELIRSSWDYERLGPVFLKGFNWQAFQAAVARYGRPYRESRSWLRSVAFDAIAKHPDTYAKFVMTQLWLQYVRNITYQRDFLQFVRNRIADVYLTDRYVPGKGLPGHVEIAKEYALMPAMPAFSIDRASGEPRLVLHEPSRPRRMYQSILEIRQNVFAQVEWVWVFGIALLLSAIRLLTSRLHHTGAFIAFILTVSVLGGSLVVALVEYGGHRYSYVMEFVYYLPTIPLIFLRPPGLTQAGRNA